MFRSIREIPIAAGDLRPVAEDLMEHFRAQGYEVAGQETPRRGWDIGMRKGGTFKAVLGMKTALKIEINSAGTVTTAKASVGIFGQQAVPTAISMLVFWPVLITQIWGLVEQAHLDEEALSVVEASLQRLDAAQRREAAANPSAGRRAWWRWWRKETQTFCHECGKAVVGTPKFCPECGTQLS